ncbi:MAG: hypothetical protein BWZ10_03233 [candidate division BRC1 bacterium ADurb.BinA364]|nr:MAG: hypothetical protein BWZ10_03233 [candidate division BRC1 bacterium ADurb.BinA364]
MSPAPGPNERRRSLPFWLLGASAAAAILAPIAWRGSALWRGRHSHARGDGKRVESYGYDLQPLLVSRATLAAAGLPKDGLRALTDPPLLSAEEMDALHFPGHGRKPFLVPGDLVIGLTINGEARAYPVRIMNWHEAANDTLGGEPILVAYSALCDAIAAFRRAVGGQTLVFGVSGLVSNSNLVLYNRSSGTIGESLWSQLAEKAIAGTAARQGLALEALAPQRLRWDEWRARHPRTTVVAPDPRLMDHYKRDPYASYYGSDMLRFPVVPLPPAGGMPLKTPTIAASAAGERRLFDLPWLFRQADAHGRCAQRLGGAELRFDFGGSPETVSVEAVPPETPLQLIHCFWFAWHAFHPEP